MKIAPLLLATTIAATLAACGGTKAQEDPVRPVLTLRVAPGAVATRDLYSGEIRARYETDVGFRVSGKITSRSVDAGARVTKGQVLARLDPEDAKLAANGAAAQLTSAEADLAWAKAEQDRYGDLLAKKFISQSAFEQKQNAFNVARGRVDQTRSQSAITTNQANYTTLVADADGVVVSVSAEPGQVVSAGQPVLKLAHAGEKEVVLNAPESQLARFTVGQEVAISLWADPSNVFRGRVREIAGGADPVTRTYTVRVSALDPPAKTQIGMTANVLFNSSIDQNLVLLPLSALAGDRDKPAVWIVEPSTGKVALRPVAVGQFREDGVTVTSGLNAGDIVVTAGVHKLRVGQAVRIAESAPQPGTNAQARN